MRGGGPFLGKQCWRALLVEQEHSLMMCGLAPGRGSMGCGTDVGCWEHVGDKRGLG